MRSHIALRLGRYVTEGRVKTIVDVLAAESHVIPHIPSIAGAGEASRGVVGAGGVDLHTSGTPRAAVVSAAAVTRRFN